MEKPTATRLPLSQIEPNNGQIKGLPKNPRLIRDIKFKKLVQSLSENPEMMELRELLVYPFKETTGPEESDKKTHYILIGGNMRYRALKELKVQDAPVKIIPETATLEQLNAYVLKDNSSYGEWDWDALTAEWDEQLLDNCGIDLPVVDEPEEEETAKEDDFNVTDNLTKNPISKEGDIWELGEHRLVCGDSTDPHTIEVLMNGDQASLYLTDPPYNVNYEGGTGLKIQNDNMASDKFLAFLTDAFSAANTALKPGGAFYIWHADSQGWNFRSAVHNTPGWQLKQNIIWNKNNIVLGHQDYQWKHEPCLYGFKEGAGHYFCQRRDLKTVIDQNENGEIDLEHMTKDEMKAMLTTILQAETSVINENKPLRNGDHPTMKPIPLFGRLITNSTRRNEIVLDTFGGSGTTIMACEQLQRRGRSVELDPVYCDVIVKRWEEFTGQRAMLVGNFKETTEKETEDKKE